MVSRWYAVLGVNVLLGIPAVVPIWMLYFIVATWAHPAPEENDGLAVVVIALGSIVAACGFLWWAANSRLARRTALRAAHFWPLGLFGTLVPTGVLVCVLS
ncbi:hypothetical protein [Streptomyces sp. NPDC052114]|uniref:hypothetical protein n=1 Tax=unclassified Streptomyces TaxID=2593676 RepID=UPI00343CA0AD